METRRDPPQRLYGVAKGAERTKATPAAASDHDHLIAVIQQTAGCSNSAAKKTLDNVLGTIAVSLKKNGKVQLPGFGTFVVRTRKAHMGRNPGTGASIKVGRSKSIRFRAGDTLRRTI